MYYNEFHLLWSFEAPVGTSNREMYFDPHCYSLFRSAFSFPVLSHLGYKPLRVYDMNPPKTPWEEIYNKPRPYKRQFKVDWPPQGV